MKAGFNFEKFKRFRKDLTILLNNPDPCPPFDRCFKLWGMMYLADTKKTFDSNSKGGGNWAPLAASTIAARRRGRTKGRVSILRDTGTLFKALTVGSPGNRFEYIKGGVRVGFGGPSRHPKGKATIRDIAVFHQKGGGHLPRREILHRPSAGLRLRMMKVLKVAVGKIINKY